MVRSRIPAALIAGGLLLFVAYAAGWGALIYAGSQRQTAQASQAADGLHYRVTDARGDGHLITIDSKDPAEILMRVSSEFGDGAKIEKVDNRQAATMQRQQEPSGDLLWVGLILILPLALIWGGLRLKSREDAVERVWRVLSKNLAADLGELARASGHDERTLSQLLARIGERSMADLKVQPELGRVYDSRLSGFSLTMQFCPRCNEPVNARMLADLNQVPTCPACQNEFDREFLDSQKQEVVDQLVTEAEKRPERNADGDFSMGRYALLLVLFPPAALAYALTKAG